MSLEQITTIDQRIFLLKRQLLFKSLPEKILSDIAASFEDLSVAAGLDITQQGGLIDSVYILVDGAAEVTKIENKKKIYIAQLNEGDTIGLNDTGYFSTSGQRNATVTASVDLTLLRLDIESLQKILLANPEINLLEETHEYLKFLLIKKAAPFEMVAYDVLVKVAKKIQLIKIAKDQIIFKQDDLADKCYLVQSGQIAISIQSKTGDKVVAELDKNSLFGELGILIEGKRNATATTLTDCELLVLSRSSFLELTSSNQNLSVGALDLIASRDRPIKAEDISIYPAIIKENEEASYIIRNLTHGKYMKISEDSLFVLNSLNGENTLLDIGFSFYEKYNILAMSEIMNLVKRFIQAGFATTQMKSYYNRKQKLTGWQKIVFNLIKILTIEIPIKNVDNLLTTVYKKVGCYFYTKTALLIMNILVVLGFVCIVIFAPHAKQLLATNPFSGRIIMLEYIPLILIIPIHELAHALTTKYYGRHVQSFGIGWFWLGPMAYTDTSDMWLGTARERLFVNFAGVYSNLVIAGCAGVLAIIITNPSLSLYFWLMALFNYIWSWANLNPFVETDGYYLLMNYINKSNLRQYSLIWLVEHARKTLFNKALIHKYKAEIIYWLTCIAYFAISLVITYFFQKEILSKLMPYSFNEHKKYLNWILPLFVLFFSVIKVYSAVEDTVKTKKLTD